MLASLNLGDVFIWVAADKVVYNLATQPVPGPSATLAAIHRSVRRALKDAEQRGIDRVGVPRLGAGLGGLDWPSVEATLRDVAADSHVELIAVTLPAATAMPRPGDVS